MSGRELQKALRQSGQKATLAAFYQLMGRLEQAGLIVGEERSQQVGKQTVYPKYYRITQKGESEFASSRNRLNEVFERPNGLRLGLATGGTAPPLGGTTND